MSPQQMHQDGKSSRLSQNRCWLASSQAGGLTKAPASRLVVSQNSKTSTKSGPARLGRALTEKSDLFLRKAAEFEAMAKEAKDVGIKLSYLQLAKNYRQLAAHVAEASNRPRES